MKTIERLHEYNGNVRTETRVEEHELYEDLLTLSRFAEDAAKIAYAFSICDEGKKADGKVALDNAINKLCEQFEICKGYGGMAE